MRAQRLPTNAPGAPRSAIDFGSDAGARGGGAGGGAGPVPAARINSIESGLHQRSGSTGGGMSALGGSYAPDAGLSFYDGDGSAGSGAGLPPRPPAHAAATGMGGAGGGMMGRGGCAGGMLGGGLPTGAMGSASGGGLKPMGRSASSSGAFLGEGFDDEPPILEELGINLSHIFAKTKSVLGRPYQRGKGGVPAEFLADADLAGPLVFCLVLGFVLLLKGKVSFGAIYGCGAVGCGGMYAVLNLMSHTGVDIYRTVSILGYCLLPIIVLAAASTIVEMRGAFGYALIPLAVLWSTNAAALFFVVLLGLDDQRWLVAYPVALFYAVFALISVF